MKKRVLALMLMGLVGTTAVGVVQGPVAIYAKDKNEADKEIEVVSPKKIKDYVKVGKYKGIELFKTPIEISPEQVDEYAKYELSSKATPVTDANATVAENDIVNINFVGMRDGKAFDGGSAENYNLQIGSHTMIPGFEEGVVGMKKGETKDVSVKFPENYPEKSLAGKEAVFKITVNEIKKVPELTNEWVAANTKFKTVEEYKKNLEDSLKEQAESKEKSDIEYNAWNKVVADSKVKDYPKDPISAAKKQYKDYMEASAKSQGKELKAFLEEQKITDKQFEEQETRFAESKVKQNLIIQYIMQEQKISLNDKESKKVEEELVKQQGAKSLEDLVKRYGKKAVDENIAFLRVQKFIIDNAKIKTEKPAKDKDKK